MEDIAEEYRMPKEMDYENIRKCLDNFKAESLYIRLKGVSGGTVKVDEDLEGKTLDIQMNSGQLSVLVDDSEVFRFPLEHYSRGFALKYERIDEKGIRIILPVGINALPEPRSSILRNVLDGHLIEIFFQGKIPLKFHSWWEKPHWKYWTIDIKSIEKK